jgi:FecR protein
MKLKQHIVIEPPTSDARRERVERKLFEQMAAVRMVERAEAVIPPPRKTRMPMWLGAGALAAAAVLAIVLVGRDSPTQTLPSPSRVVTPLGGTTQFTVPGALIEAQSDTSVEVHHGANGAITLEVKRGAIECNVEHRENRPPFKVVAGEVSVEVVGTIFTVTKTPSPRVDVARGKVRVTAPGGQWMIEAGETWPTTQTAASEPEPVVEQPVVVEAPAAKKTTIVAAPVKDEPKVEPAKVEVTKEEKDLAKETYRIAAKLEDTDPAKAAQLYRSIATNGKGMEALALVSLAEVELKLKHPAKALAALDELKQRFPKAANTEEAAWWRYEALRTTGKRDEARGVADEYLRQFPNGAYAERLRP